MYLKVGQELMYRNEEKVYNFVRKKVFIGKLIDAFLCGLLEH